MDNMTMLDELHEALRLLETMEANAARIAERQDAQEQRTTALERIAEQRVRGLEATVAEQRETLDLAGAAMKAVQDVCIRHGHDPMSGLSVIDWLEHVLDWAAAGWPSMN